MFFSFASVSCPRVETFFQICECFNSMSLEKIFINSWCVSLSRSRLSCTLSSSGAFVMLPVDDGVVDNNSCNLITQTTRGSRNEASSMKTVLWSPSFHITNASSGTWHDKLRGSQEVNVKSAGEPSVYTEHELFSALSPIHVEVDPGEFCTMTVSAKKSMSSCEWIAGSSADIEWHHDLASSKVLFGRSSTTYFHVTPSTSRRTSRTGIVDTKMTKEGMTRRVFMVLDAVWFTVYAAMNLRLVIWSDLVIRDSSCIFLLTNKTSGSLIYENILPFLPFS